MKRIDDLSEKIRDAVNADGHVVGERHFAGRNDEFMHLCVAMDTLGDATHALLEFERRGLGDNDEMYLRFYGMFQAVILQQDALSAIGQVIVGKPETQPQGSRWIEIRDLRNLAVGHPTDKGTGTPGKRMRSFVPRLNITARTFSLLIHDEVKHSLDPRDVDFGAVYDGYKEEALAYAERILRRIDDLRAELVAGAGD